jgi:uncharacterized protein
MRNIVPELERIIRDRLIGWPPDWEGYHWPGYTYEHTLRVRDLALTLAERERADPDVVLLAALLHDIRKDSGRDHAEVGANEAGRILKDLGVSDRISARVCEAISLHSGSNTPDSPVESLCLGDADFIDGNFGIVAVWRFLTIRSGHGHPLMETIEEMRSWLPRKEQLLVSPGPHTRGGREIARQRAARMQVFADALLDASQAKANGHGPGLMDLAACIHGHCGRTLLTEQFADFDRLAATEDADPILGAVCRSVRLEVAGKH